MKAKTSLQVLQGLFSVVLCLSSIVAEAQSSDPPVSRFAFKTNAFEWLMTIPNAGVEFDLQKSEFNKFTMSVSAKYNWNTYHSFAPSVLFNLMDVRPEFRYYYRTRKPERGVKHHWYDVNKHLRDRKNPRPWRAHYVGLYGNYGHYGFKLTEKGYQGEVAGFGASAGYALPLYEYRKGYVDVELGFAVGVQWATKDVFTHDQERYHYVNLSSRKDFAFTPFPVVSELRVAFAWRSKSIKDKVKYDTEKKRVERHYEKIKNDFKQPVLDLTKTYYDEVLVNTKSDRERKKIMVTDTLYNTGFYAMVDAAVAQQKNNVASSFPDEMKNHDRTDIRNMVEDYENTLIGGVEDAEETVLKAFRKESKEYFKGVRKQMKAEAAQRKKEEKAAAKAAKAAQKEQPEEETPEVKQEKRGSGKKETEMPDSGKKAKKKEKKVKGEE